MARAFEHGVALLVGIKCPQSQAYKWTQFSFLSPDSWAQKVIPRVLILLKTMESQAEEGRAPPTPTLPLDRGNSQRTADPATTGSPDNHGPPTSPHTEGSLGSTSTGSSRIATHEDMLKDAPKSWPTAALLQVTTENLSSQRRFQYSWHRVLLEEQSIIHRLEEVVWTLDGQPENESTGTPFADEEALSGLQALFWPQVSGENGVGDEQQSPQQERGQRRVSKSQLLDVLHSRLKRYAESLLILHDLEKLPKVKRRPWETLVNRFANEDLLRGNGWDFLHRADDALTTRADRIDLTIVGSQLYKNSWLAKSLKLFLRTKKKSGESPGSHGSHDRNSSNSSTATAPGAADDANPPISGHLLARFFRKIRWLASESVAGGKGVVDASNPSSGSSNSSSDPTTEFYHAVYLDLFAKMIVVWVSGILLLAPIIILFLGDLRKTASLAVVVCFATAFVVVMVLRRVKYEVVLAAFSAYLAVLVVFLSNQQQQDCVCALV
ncbi:hypothetical protein F4778DRAFT_11096 [Xylariomycetidae sp. FL2044]|nr:hypothetical protein F4778DRAFT_11096 [Xylariomycetidae sp. FL2044]